MRIAIEEDWESCNTDHFDMHRWLFNTANNNGYVDAEAQEHLLSLNPDIEELIHITIGHWPAPTPAPTGSSTTPTPAPETATTPDDNGSDSDDSDDGDSDSDFGLSQLFQDTCGVTSSDEEHQHYCPVCLAVPWHNCSLVKKHPGHLNCYAFCVAIPTWLVDPITFWK